MYLANIDTFAPRHAVLLSSNQSLLLRAAVASRSRLWLSRKVGLRKCQIIHIIILQSLCLYIA